MSDRFFSAKPITGDRVTLDGPEAHHLLHVMRATVGTEVALFDNSGAEFVAVVESTRRSEAILRVTDRREVNRELPFPLIVGVALPKGDRQKWLVEKLTELGVTALVPLLTERGVAQPTASAAERLARSVIEATKQCGRTRLMQIAPPQSLATFLTTPLAGDPQSPEARRLIAHPNATPLAQLNLSSAVPIMIAIGPEGGFTDPEVGTAVAAGWQSVSLGNSILRVETAAIALVATIALHVAPEKLSQ
jgi:16S rRNA (uracil1498-N3)-methyltransferase